MSTTQETPDVSPPGEEPSPRYTFKERLRAYQADHPELSVGQIASFVTRQIMHEDRDLAEAYFIREGELILSWELRADMVQTRRGIYRVIDISKNGESEVERMPEKKKASVYEKMVRWSEFNPITGQSQLLLSFTKPVLLASADVDADTVAHHAEKALWKRRLAEGLPNDTTTIEEHYRPDEVLKAIAAAKTSVAHDIAAGRIRIQITKDRNTPQLTLS